MSLNRWVNGVLVILVVIWGVLSVEVARMEKGLSRLASPAPQAENKTVQHSPETVPPTQTPEQVQSVQIKNSAKPTSSAEAAVRNLFAKLESAATPTPTASFMVTPVPTPTQTPTPITQVSYKIHGGGVFYEGALDAASLSVGEATKRIAAHHGISYVYNATPLGWFVTELASLKQSPAQEKYWLYWVNGAFGEVSVDKKILQPGDTLIWQYGS